MPPTPKPLYNLHWLPDHPDTSGWKTRHTEALADPKGIERGIVCMLDGWLHYGRRHLARYGSNIGQDGVLGPEWQAIGEALRGLLNGELGRLDAGTVDTIIAETLRAEGLGEE